MEAAREARAGQVPLVIDANVVIAAIARDGLTRGMLLSLPLDFHAPEYLREEVFRHVHPHAPLITESGAGFFQAQRVLNRLLSVIHLHPPLDYIEFDSLALSIAPHEEDAAYLALAITLGCPLWSNDHALAKQNEVRVLTTQDVLTFIGK